MSGPVDGSVEVDGGELALAVWPGEGPTVLALHGITASSREFVALARALPGVRLVAPDLRGRARSNGLPGPFGLRQHAEDLRRVLDAIGGDRVVVLGHSMGGFPALLLAAAEPDRVRGLVLADGGLPLPVPPGTRREDLLALSPAALLGPAFERLTRVFPSREDYARFWQGHPAFAGVWNDDIAAYVDYDLEPADGGFRPAANPDAVAADLPEQLGFDWYHRAMAGLRQPVTVLRAPLGLLADPPGIYPPGVLEGFRAEIPQLEVVEVPDVNHYTLMMTSPGVDRVAEAVVAATTES
ncbi:MAG: alpha/beta fold hydrolase [Amnibacterium sp.]